MESRGKQFGGSREGGTMGTLMAGKGRGRGEGGTKGGGERTGKREREFVDLTNPFPIKVMKKY